MTQTASTIELIADAQATEERFLRQIFVRQSEDQIGDLLREALAAVPGIEIGSYPRFDTTEYKVKITVEARDRELVERGIAHLLSRLDAAAVVRVE